MHELLKLGKPRGAAKSIEYPLKGKVHCSECRRTMNRMIGRKGAAYYICRKSDSEPDASCPQGKHFMEADIERVVLHAIQQMLTLYQQEENQKGASRFTRTGQINACMTEISRLQQLQESHRQEKLRLYESYISGGYSKERYLKKKTEIDQMIQALNAQAKAQENALTTLESEAHAPEDALNRLSNQYMDAPALTKEMVQAFIQEIFVYPNSQIEIVWKFKDCFAALLENQNGG